ncbi:MAG: hypothetical protein QM811_09830 [Pirellulales bacterium]
MSKAASVVSPTKPHDSFVKRWLKRLAYVVYLLVVVELALQLFYLVTTGQWLFKNTALPIYAPNETTLYWNKPNLDFEHRTPEFRSRIVTNAQGLRVGEPGKEFAPGESPDRERILLLGPSFAFGWGVDYEKSAGAELEKLLNRDRVTGGKPIELINAGVPSLGAAQSRDWYLAKGARYHPRYVVQFIYGSMAVSPEFPRHKFALTPEGYLVKTTADDWVKRKAQLKKFATIYYLWRLSLAFESRNAEKPQGDAIQGAGRDLKTAAQFAPTNPEVVISTKFYRDYAQAVRKHGARLVLVYFPLSYCVHAEDVPRWRRPRRERPGSRVGLQRGVLRLCARAGRRLHQYHSRLESCRRRAIVFSVGYPLDRAWQRSRGRGDGSRIGKAALRSRGTKRRDHSAVNAGNFLAFPSGGFRISQ